MNCVIEPAFEKNNIAIYCASSNLYAPYVDVMLESIAENATQGNNYDFLVLETDISDDNKTRILKTVEKFSNFSVRFIDIGDIVNAHSFITAGHHSKYNFYRLTAPDVLVEYKKIIYLDSDLVVNHDLADLYNIDLGDNYVAAVKCIGMAAAYNRNPGRKKYVDDILKMSDPEGYFNSGVMLLNLEKIRQKVTCSQLLKMATESYWMFCDQCLLNVLFQGSVLYLPQRWNILSHSPNYNNEKFLPEELYKEYMADHDIAYISHYSGNRMPLFVPDVDMAENFWRYAHNSQVFDILQARMEENREKQTPQSQADYKDKEIAIFVSHRIDYPCDGPSSPPYHPVRCGAVFDKTKSAIPGDDSGDNISKKRSTFCEMTVQYWAWKNFDADYYGLCHYRRYFSFSDTQYPEHRFNVPEKKTVYETTAKYSLLDEEKIRKTVCRYDLIVPKSRNVCKLASGPLGKENQFGKSVREFWELKTDQFIQNGIETLVEIVKDKAPQYYAPLISYLEGTRIYGNLCYIMKKELFIRFCEFVYPVLFELEKRYDLTEYSEQMMRLPGLCGEILMGAFTIALMQEGARVKELQLVFYNQYSVTLKKAGKGIDKSMKTSISKQWSLWKEKIKKKIRRFLKKIMRSVFPAYRVALRIETYLKKEQPNPYQLNKNSASIANTLKAQASLRWATILHKPVWEQDTLTSSLDVTKACFALEVHETHKAAFSEFHYCHTGQDVVVVATGPSMRYYTQLTNTPHIGMNAAYKREDLKLNYYFMTDYRACKDFLDDLVNYDFVKFFGQYSVGKYRDFFQVPEDFLYINNGRRFFQAAPSEDIPVNIEYYPLMGFYSIAFQAIQFALYTNPKRIYLVGCDCTNGGYFDGNEQATANPPLWVKGYKKLNEFAQRFYPNTEIISINPVGLKGLFHDVYTESYLKDHPEIDPTTCEILR